jgi:uncharacterized protein YjbJ (UPF0337 family)
MENQNTTNNPASQKLNAEIRMTWGKLTDEEIGFYEGKRDKFFDAVKAKYSIDRNEAEKTVKKLETEGSNASGSTAKPANDSASTAGPVAKAANA